MENIIDTQAIRFGYWLLRNAEPWLSDNWRYMNYPEDYTTEEMYQKFLDEAVEKL